MPHIWPPFVTRRIDIVCFTSSSSSKPNPEMTCILFVVGNHLFSVRFKIFLLASQHIWLHFAGGKSIFFRHVRAPPCFFSFLLCFVPARAVRQMETINSSRFYCRAAGPRCTGKSGAYGLRSGSSSFSSGR